jgi:hypothetical protein
MSTKHVAGRRGFIKQTAAMTAGLAGLGMLPEVAAATPDTGVNILGPKPRYSPQVGTMVSDLCRYTPETGLSVKRLFYKRGCQEHSSSSAGSAVMVRGIQSLVR